MKTGDIVTDSRAAAWTLGALLGDGAWGRVWSVRDDKDRTRVLKAPYEPEDLPPASADRVPLMRQCAIEQADLLGEEHDHLVTLEDRITLPTGAIALLMPQTPTTLARQLASGIPLVEALDEIFMVAEILAASRMAHGNLRPSNILIASDGHPILSDPLTPTLQTLMPGAERENHERRRWSASDHIASDTWALCSALFAAVMLDETGSDAKPQLPEPSRTGLDKVTLANLRDHAIARLRRDGANPRFIHRTAERISTLLARGLSEQADPSPPYRFLTAADLKPRLAEIQALVKPGIESVGRLLLSSAAKGEVFDAPGPIGFTVSVGPTAGINDPDDLVCGVRLTDLDAADDGRVPLEDAQFAVNRHPSGRLRFEFNIPEVTPGRYRVRVAFSIKDSGEEPMIAEGSFQVRPPPGYVPPASEDAPAALSFPGQAAGLTPLNVPRPDHEEEEDDDATVLMKLPNFDTDGSEDTDPDADGAGGELIQAFPKPLAPSSPGTLIDEQPAPPPVVPSLPRPAPLLAAVPTPPPSEPGLTGPPTAPPTGGATLTAAQPPPVLVPSIALAPTPSLASPPTPPPAPLGTEPPEWQASQEHESEFFHADAGLPNDGGLPGDGEDLMGPTKPSLLDTLKDQLGDHGRPDSPMFFAAAIVGCFIFIVLLFALLRAC